MPAKTACIEERHIVQFPRMAAAQVGVGPTLKLGRRRACSDSSAGTSRRGPPA